MLDRHPFKWIAETSQKRAFWFLFAFTILVIVGMQFTGGPLHLVGEALGDVEPHLAGADHDDVRVRLHLSPGRSGGLAGQDIAGTMNPGSGQRVVRAKRRRDGACGTVRRSEYG